MNQFIYLSVLPEALIASMLSPIDFGEYMATGTRKKTRGQAIFFEVDPEAARDLLPMDYINKRCVRKEDGSPKSSVYLSVYRVLEQVPMKALKSLYLVTDDGRVLELKKDTYNKNTEKTGMLHLYQELCPVTPVIASTLAPSAFARELTSDCEQVHIPRLLFVELMLEQLAADPLKGSAQNLPYPNIAHLRDCLIILRNEPDKTRKTVLRTFNGTLLYRTCTNGFFVADKDEIIYYPYPSMHKLEEEAYDFWRSL